MACECQAPQSPLRTCQPGAGARAKPARAGHRVSSTPWRPRTPAGGRGRAPSTLALSLQAGTPRSGQPCWWHAAAACKTAWAPNQLRLGAEQQGHVPPPGGPSDRPRWGKYSTPDEPYERAEAATSGAAHAGTQTRCAGPPPATITTSCLRLPRTRAERGVQDRSVVARTAIECVRGSKRTAGNAACRAAWDHSMQHAMWPATTT
jgi:hypothetical protein